MESVLSSLAETAALLKPDDGQREDVDRRVHVLRQSRRRLESQMRREFDPTLSLLLDALLEQEEALCLLNAEGKQ
jgi:hypothetical protein